MNLNQEQLTAVHKTEGPCLVIAGAGSGKTRVVTQRMIHLIEKGVAPSSILGLTFTNKAAEEMKERVQASTAHRLLICTFHSLGAKILRESIHYLGFERNFTIYDQEDSDKLLKRCLKEISSVEKLDPKAFRGMISRAKNDLESPDDIKVTAKSSEEEKLLPEVYAIYQKKLQECNALDFDDLLFLTTKLFQQHPEALAYYQQRWRYIHVDEYQDTNQTQYTLVQLLSAAHNNLFAVGDPDQSIYSWRGANIQNILHFEKDFSDALVIKLEQNYRSSSNILNAANALIQYNEGRYEKNLWSDLGEGEKITDFAAASDREEAGFVADRIQEHRREIPLNEMAILYRTNAQSRLFEDKLLSNRIPYTIVGGISFYQRREIKDLLAFLKVVSSDKDFIAFARTINLPKRGIGPTTIEKIALHSEKEGMPLVAYCQALVTNVDLSYPVSLSRKQMEGLKEYVGIIQHLRAHEGSLENLVLETIGQTGYLGHLKLDAETFSDRKDNVDQLMTKAHEWEENNEDPSLENFLEELSLKTTLDEAQKDEPHILLMTLHNGKGLEFSLTFLAGMEEDILPHVNSRNSEEALEEERRLCYVGMTRAKRYLYITHAKNRFLWGSARQQRPSRFLKEIPYKYKQSPGFRQAPTSFETKSTLPKETADFSEGDNVFHNDFGVGIINETYDSSLGLTYKIFFPKDNRERAIVAKYANLKTL